MHNKEIMMRERSNKVNRAVITSVNLIIYMVRLAVRDCDL
jgi:hypothetical protein